MAAKAGTAYVAVDADLSPLHRSVAQATGPLSSRFGKLGRAATAGLVGLTAASAGAARALFDIGQQYDNAQDQIRVGTGKTGKQLKRLERDFRAVARTVPTDFDAASTAVAGLNRRLDVTGRPLRALSRRILELSRLTETDLNTNIEAATRLFGDWGIATAKQPATLDKLFRATQQTGIGVDRLSQLMVQFGSPLRQLGLDFDTTVAMFSKFEKEGVNIQTAIPGLRMALKNFARDGREPADALARTIERIREAGSEAAANTRAFRVFGTRAGPDLAAAIREGRFDFDRLIRTIGGGRDTILRASKATRDFSERWQIFKNRVLLLLEPVAIRVFDAVGSAMERIGEINLRQVIADTRGFRDALASAAATVGPMLFTAGELAFKLGQLSAGFAQSRVGVALLGAAAGALIGRMVALAGAFAVSKIVAFVGSIRSLIATMGVLRSVYIAQTGITNASTGAILRHAAASRLAAGASRGLALAMASTGFGAIAVLVGTVAGALFGLRASNDRAKISARNLTDALRSQADALRALRDIDLDAAQARANLRSANVAVEEAERRLDGLRRRGLQGTLAYRRAEADLAQARVQQKRAQRDLNDLEESNTRKRQDAAAEAGRSRRVAEGRIDQLRDETSALRDNIARNEELLSRWGRHDPAGNAARRVRADLTAQTEELTRKERELSRTLARVDAIDAQTSKIGRLERQLGGLTKGTDAYRRTARRLRDAQDSLLTVLDGSRPAARRASGAFGVLGDNVAALGSAMGDVSRYTSDETNRLLQNFGAKPLKQQVKGFKLSPAQRFMRALGLQRGGPINLGAPSGDTVPAMLERGEYVLNREAVSKLGRGALDRINFGLAPRFQAGGFVHVPGDPAGPYGDSVSKSVAGLAAWLVRTFKLNITAAFDPGGRHRSPGHNVTGTAIDIVPGPGGSWDLVGDAVAAAVARGMTVYYDGSRGSTALSNHGPGNHAHIELGSGRGGVAAPELGQLVIDGGTDTTRRILRGVAQRLRGAANEFLSKHVAALPETGEIAGLGSGAELMRRISSQRGWSFADWWELDGRETGHGTDLFNPASRASLRGQFLPINWGKYGPGSDPRLDPSMDQQIWSMSEYIDARYGNPSAALAHHDAHNWYQRGGVVGGLRRTLRILSRGKPKARKRALRGLLDTVRGLELPGRLQKNLAQFAADADLFGDKARMASELTVDTEAGPIPGVIDSRSETQWRGMRLDALLKWRNTMLRALEITNRLREQVQTLVAQARERLTGVAREIIDQGQLKRRLEAQLERLQRHPRRNRAVIADTKDRLKDLTVAQRSRVRVRDGLKDRILPALRGRAGRLKSGAEGLISNLETIQGKGFTRDIIRSLRPSQIGILGGDIFSEQILLRDLRAPRPVVLDTFADTARNDTQPDGSERESLLERLLLEERQRSFVANRQFDVFRNLPPFGGVFHEGGTVAGPRGAERTIIAKAGETFIPEGAGIQTNVRVVLEDRRTRVLVDDVEQAVETITGRQARRGGQMARLGQAGVLR
jgi:hypothetical protein